MYRFSFYGLVPGNLPLMAASIPSSGVVFVASRAVVCATLAAAAGACTAALADALLRRRVAHRPALDGALAGLVAISAGAPGQGTEYAIGASSCSSWAGGDPSPPLRCAALRSAARGAALVDMCARTS